MMKGEPEKITITSQGQLRVPDKPIIPFIQGDGIGQDIWPAAQLVIDKAVESAFSGGREILWTELLVGEKGYTQTGEWLSEAALDAIRAFFTIEFFSTYALASGDGER